MSPVDPVWHPLVDLVGHPVVKVQDIKAIGGGGESDHQVPLHHVEPHAPPLELHALHHEAAPHFHRHRRSAKPDQLGLLPREGVLDL